ncbi:hypothetical protein H4R34_002550 [Dimargaris verticillata]|uniref:Uncharacterized protein n=1 Tax=Dimargaris verticillata TaxID=2761393 RepID=A0A9W8EDZ6_9FUNG|nr:hypothetical protein H4R34_002550 [Dimargaris verticillata]
MKASASAVGVLLLGLLAHLTALPVPQLPVPTVQPRALTLGQPVADSTRTHVRRLSARLNRVPMALIPQPPQVTVFDPAAGFGQPLTTTPTPGSSLGFSGTTTGFSNPLQQVTAPQSSQLGSSLVTQQGTFDQFPYTGTQSGSALHDAGSWPGFSSSGVGMTGVATTPGATAHSFWPGVSSNQVTTTQPGGLTLPQQSTTGIGTGSPLNIANIPILGDIGKVGGSVLHGVANSLSPPK